MHITEDDKMKQVAKGTYLVADVSFSTQQAMLTSVYVRKPG